MADERGRLSEIFLTFLRLGLTSFGGPIAHLGYFRAELVARRRWLTDQAFADLVALCQFLPGPASSQVVMGIGLSRGGLAGAVLASIAFTLPSMLLMIAFGYGVVGVGSELSQAAWIHTLKVVAAAVVAQAVWAMARSLCPDRLRASLALGAAALVALWPGPAGQLVAIGAGALIGWRACRVDPGSEGDPLPVAIGRRTGLGTLAAFFVLLGLALAAQRVGEGTGLAGLDLVAAMYRAGALVFGGGHVVLPLLEVQMVAPGHVSADAFLAGYGAAQALPGPLFTFASFLGTAQSGTPNGWLGGLIATLGIFLPSFLLLLGTLPFWAALRRLPAARAALAGTNAAVVGLLIAAFYDPVFTRAISSAADFALGLGAFALLQLWRVPAWLLVLGLGGGTALATAI